MSQKLVRVGGINCGADELFLISGPCVIEEESVMMKTAEKLKEISAKLSIPVIYKSSFLKDNRSSLKYYDGPGLDQGLKTLAKVKEQYGFPLLKGVFTDGDLRPLLQKEGEHIIDKKVGSLVHKTPICIDANALLYEAEALFKKMTVDTILVTENGKPFGMLDIQDL